MVVVFCLYCVYCLGQSLFADRLFPNTTMGSTSLGMKTHAEANEELAKLSGNYTLTVSGAGEDVVFSSELLGVTATNQTVESLGLVGNAAAWPLELFASHAAPASAVVAYDAAVLEANVQGWVDAYNNMVPAGSPATLRYDQATSQFSVVNAVPSQQLSYDAVLAQVKAAVDNGATAVKLDDSCVMNSQVSGPSVEQLKKEAGQLNTSFGFNFTVALGSSALLPINRGCALDWVNVDADYNVTYSEERFQEWLGRLGDSLNTAGGTHTYTRADGKEVSVTGGTYGWQVDRDALYTAIRQGIDSNSTNTVALTCAVEGNGYQGPDGPDCGRYIDVDITEQHARLYDVGGAVLWETDVITGYDNGTYDTPTGFFVINAKESPSVLQSSSTYDGGDGTEPLTITYRHEVEYWMPFYGNFIGFHDAPWQTDGWGGDMYHDPYYGSGGCVNLPTEKAAELWDLVQVGLPVSVHY